MISPETFSAGHIRRIQKQSRRDPALIERSIFALGLLEAIARTDLQLIFKGGSALMLLLDRPRRFSTDIDIVVAPGIEVEKHLEIAATIWPFIEIREHFRNVVDQIEKRHFKFTFASPLTNREYTIPLDILFEENPYSTTVEKSINNELLVIENPVVNVLIPNSNCIIADKLSAFAPHTTGIRYNADKELEIIKQLYDVATLLDYVDDFAEVKTNYKGIANTEIWYRGIDVTPEDALRDAINAAVCVAGRGLYNPDEYSLLKKGILNISNHIYSESFNGEVAVQRACMVMYLAAAILTDQDSLPDLKDDEYYLSAIVRADEYKKLGYVRKMDSLAYKYLFEAVEMLSEK